MTTLSTIIEDIQSIIQDDDYTNTILKNRINDAANNISAGIRMPDGSTSPALPDLYTSSIVYTTTDANIDLPSNYQREIFSVVDSNGDIISPINGGGYYSFRLFLKYCFKKDLSETGLVTRVCVKGGKLYYQGIPSSPSTLTVHYYRKPVRMTENSDTPDGIPEHLQMRLIKHYVCRDIYGEGLEDGAESKKVGTSYHTNKFIEAMFDLVDYIGIDATPEYYGNDFNYNINGGVEYY